MDTSAVNMVADLSHVTGTNSPLFGLTLNDGIAYVTAWNDPKVIAVDLNTGVLGQVQVNGNDVLFSIVSSDLKTQPQGKTIKNSKSFKVFLICTILICFFPIPARNIMSQCKYENGGCSHICMPLGGPFATCMCPSRGGLTLDNDGLSCTGIL